MNPIVWPELAHQRAAGLIAEAQREQLARKFKAASVNPVRLVWRALFLRLRLA